MEILPGIRITLIRNSGMTWTAWIEEGDKYPGYSVGNFDTPHQAIDALMEKAREVGLA
jgi:hypothetical protein